MFCAFVPLCVRRHWLFQCQRHKYQFTLFGPAVLSWRLNRNNETINPEERYEKHFTANRKAGPSSCRVSLVYRRPAGLYLALSALLPGRNVGGEHHVHRCGGLLPDRTIFPFPRSSPGAAQGLANHLVPELYGAPVNRPVSRARTQPGSQVDRRGVSVDRFGVFFCRRRPGGANRPGKSFAVSRARQDICGGLTGGNGGNRAPAGGKETTPSFSSLPPVQIGFLHCASYAFI